jgi:hypothetical protein
VPEAFFLEELNEGIQLYAETKGCLSKIATIFPGYIVNLH